MKKDVSFIQPGSSKECGVQRTSLSTEERRNLTEQNSQAFADGSEDWLLSLWHQCNFFEFSGATA